MDSHRINSVVIHELNKNPQDHQIAQMQAQLMEDHHRGKHPYGQKRRGCPLCVQGK